MTDIELEYVTSTYNVIAKEFDDSRYCVWNFVKQFLVDKKHMFGIDVGCGNGKNMIHENMVGIDTCDTFVKICEGKNKRVLKSCCCDVPFEDNTFDYSMSISVLHHLSSEERRIQAIRELIRIVKTGGQILFNMWSVEHQEKRLFHQGDNYVPWNMKPKKNEPRRKYTRYYYIHNYESIVSFCETIRSLFKNVSIDSVFNEKGNWVVLITKS